MTALSTAAWVAHDIGLAASFGGPLFGKLSLKRAIERIPDQAERGVVAGTAWNDFNLIDALALGTATVTWFAGRLMISGRSIDRTTRALVLAKDVLLSATLATSVFNAVGGNYLQKQMRSGTGNGQAQAQGQGAMQQLKRPDVLRRVIDTVGTINLLSSAGVIGLTAILGQKAAKSTRWKLISRLLP